MSCTRCLALVKKLGFATHNLKLQGWDLPGNRRTSRLCAPRKILVAGTCGERMGREAVLQKSAFSTLISSLRNRSNSAGTQQLYRCIAPSHLLIGAEGTRTKFGGAVTCGAQQLTQPQETGSESLLNWQPLVIRAANEAAAARDYFLISHVNTSAPISACWWCSVW